MLKRNCYLSLLSLISLAVVNSAQASCAFSPAATAQSFTIPLDSRTFSVPPGVAVGQIIARQDILVAAGTSLTIRCSTGPVYQYYQYAALPRALSPGFTDVYQTSVAGIGVRFRSSFLTPYPTSHQSSTGSSVVTTAESALGSYIEFIKTAETVTPGQILASSLPTAELAGGQATSKVAYARFVMSGQFTITVPTCNITPASASMVVQMGSYLASEFSGINSGSAWKNASIQLADCAQFYGNAYLLGRSLLNTSPTPLRANGLSVTLAPRNGTIDATKGIMEIDDIAGKATGVGIQLSSSESTSALINLTTGITQTLPQDGTTAITIPLYARYIQTENTVTPGKANGKLEYTITYQ